MVDSTNLPEVDINAIATDLNNKMDRDGSNVGTLSQSFMNMFMPDYANAENTNLTHGNTYTCPENGYIMVDTYVMSSSGYSFEIKINDVYVMQVASALSGSYRAGGNLFPVAKGDEVYLRGSANDLTIQFIPMRGVNS